MQHHPHTAEAIETAISRLDIPTDRICAAALHLATPESSVVGIDIIERNEAWWWRGASIERPHQITARSVSERAATLATLRWRQGEVAVDLGGWCLKPVRSGAHIILAGSFLHRGPEILCAFGVADPVAAGIAYLTNPMVGDGVMEVGSERYFVHGDERVVWVHPSGNGSGPDRSSVRQYGEDGVADVVCGLLDLPMVEAASIGSRFVGTTDVDYVGQFESDGTSFEVIIPCTLGTSCIIGAPHGSAAPGVLGWYHQQQHDEWYGVAGYVPIEPARFEPGWVAKHERSGTYVILRRA